jgi:hypothetical protein
MYESGSEAPRAGRALRAARSVSRPAGFVDLDGDAWVMQVWLAERAQEAAARLRPTPSPVEMLERAAFAPAGPPLFAALERVDVADLSADDAVTYLQQVQRASAWLAGFESQTRAAVTDKVVAEVQAQMDQDADPGRPQYVCAEQVAFSEITAALRMSPRTGEARILEAQELTNAWKPLLEAMLAGDITIDHTRAVGRELRNLPGHGSVEPEVEAEYRKSCAKVLAKVVPFAITHSPGETARKARDLVTAVDPAGARARRRKAAEQDHGVFLNPLEPGTSEIRAVMPTAYAEAVHQAVRMLAKDPRFETADGCVTKGQRQAAALVALTLGDPGSVAEVTGPVHEAKINVHVNVLVPLETITSASDACGRIGNTPATADEVRDLIAEAAVKSSTIRRLVTDSAGCILDAGRSHYLASDIQKLVIRLRDGYCRFPGCNAPAERCEVDHVVPYDAGGPTDLWDLGPLCKFHHQMKTGGYWHIIASHRDGTCRWRSPLGRIYEHTPPDLTPPRPPDDLPDDEPPF